MTISNKKILVLFEIALFIQLGTGKIAAHPIDSLATLIISNDSKRATFLYYDDFFNHRIQLRQKSKYGPGRQDTVRLDLKRKTQIRFPSGKYQNIVYLSPNDTIYVQYIPEEQTIFTSPGRSTDELNFLNYLESKHLGIGDRDLVGISWNSKTKINFVLNEYERLYNERVHLLDKYSDSLDFTADFKSVVSNEFKLIYLDGMLQPILKIPNSSELMPSYFEELDKFKSWINNYQLLKSCFWYNYVLGGYHMYLNRNSVAKNDYFKSWFYSYPQYFDKNSSDLLQYNLLHDAMSNPPSSFQECLEVFRKNENDASLIKHLQSDIVSNKKILDSLVTSEIFLNERLTDLKGNSIYWKEIIKLNVGNVSYIDLWASWCGPCRIEMPNSISLKNRTLKHQLKFLYISIDDDTNKWIKSIGNLNLNYENAQNYRLNPESSLAKFLTNDGIPKYIIINKSGSVFSLNASRPGSSDIEKTLIDSKK